MAAPPITSPAPDAYFVRLCTKNIDVVLAMLMKAGEGVVQDAERAMRLGKLRYGRNVRDFRDGIGGGFQRI